MSTTQEDQERSKGGRPRYYATPEEFDARVDAYLEHCKAEKEPILWTGMALFLGFSSRQSIDEYAKYPGFSDSVKRAKALVEAAYERRLAEGSNAAAPIFALKNFGWTDKQEIDHRSGDGSMTPKDAGAAVLEAIRAKHDAR